MTHSAVFIALYRHSVHVATVYTSSRHGKAQPTRRRRSAGEWRSRHRRAVHIHPSKPTQRPATELPAPPSAHERHVSWQKEGGRRLHAILPRRGRSVRHRRAVAQPRDHPRRVFLGTTQHCYVCAIIFCGRTPQSSVWGSEDAVSVTLSGALRSPRVCFLLLSSLAHACGFGGGVVSHSTEP